jgi:hypothetical protein
MSDKKNKNTKCVRISENTHQEVVKHVGDKIKIGAFVDEASLEKIKKEKAKK